MNGENVEHYDGCTVGEKLYITYEGIRTTVPCGIIIINCVSRTYLYKTKLLTITVSLFPVRL